MRLTAGSLPLTGARLSEQLDLSMLGSSSLRVVIGETVLLIDAPVLNETLKVSGVAINATSSLPADYTIAEALTVDQTTAALSGVSIRSNVDGTFTWLGTVAGLAGVLETSDPLVLDLRASLTKDAGATTRVARVRTVTVEGTATLALEWRTADMPVAGTTLTAGQTVNLRLGEELVPFTIAPGTTAVFSVSASGERVLTLPMAMGQIVSASTSAGAAIGLVATAPGEISAVRWQNGTPVDSDPVDISASESAFFKAAFLTNTSNALGRLQDAAAVDFDLSLDLSAISGNVDTFTIGGTLTRSPETDIPIKGVAFHTFTARVNSATGALTLAISTTNPAIVVLAEQMDASNLAGMLANAPAASNPVEFDGAALTAAFSGAAVNREVTVDLSSFVSGGVAPVTFTSTVGTVT